MKPNSRPSKKSGFSNHRLRALLLTSWPLIDMMYDDKWPSDPSGGVTWKEIEDESNCWDVSEFNNISSYEKTWPNPNEKCLDGTTYVFAKTALGQRAITGLELVLASTIHNA
jgi:hypothetical protein